MEYSAVTQPRPALRSQPGTPGSMVAQVRTRVLPSETSTEPSAVWTKPGVRESGRSSCGLLPPGRKNVPGACIGGLYGKRAASGVMGGAGFKTGNRDLRGPEQE